VRESALKAVLYLSGTPRKLLDSIMRATKAIATTNFPFNPSPVLATTLVSKRVAEETRACAGRDRINW
jgi:hypothetical protein